MWLQFKTNYNKVLYAISSSLLFTLLVFSGCETSKSSITTNYDEHSSIEQASKEYEVWVNGEQVFVNTARVQDPPWEKERTGLNFGGDYSFCSFDMSNPVKVEIKSTNKVLDYTILRPSEINVKDIVRSTTKLSFTIDKPSQIIIEPDGKNSPLFIFANAIDDYKPDLNDPNLIYYGPGVHNTSNDLIELTDNQTLYVDQGAIVKAGIKVNGGNVTIRGKGIICGNEFVWGKYSHHLIEINRSSNVVVRDVILRGGASWSMIIRGSENIHVNNIKVMGGRAQNDDGINPVNSRDVKISNCFIRTDDDCIALKGMDATSYSVERITVENCILWCDRARIFLLGHESRATYMRDLIFKNIDIVHFSMTPFLLEPGENMRLENVVFEDFRINGEKQHELIRLKPVVNQYMKTQVPGYINEISFKNINIVGEEGLYKIELIGADEEYSINNISFSNFEINNNKVTKDYNNLTVGDFVSNITFD